MESLKGRNLLVLGGTTAVLDVLRYAREAGIHTIIAANGGINEEVKRICDDIEPISTADTSGLVDLIHRKYITGVMTGASEFNIQQCIKVAEKAGLHFFMTQDQWNLCANKASFKAMCRKYHVPSVEQFDPEKPESFRYPVIVKPVDACSARGVSVCPNHTAFMSGRFSQTLF